MYLKRIELSGFKSFAQKTRFEFHSGITGIVGPNGSGKSNVSDAVRWVLGEQNARQLRGSNMQDVIFAGTATRKPVSYASVSLTLDNEDGALPVSYKEVTVTRRIYRSGESEYLLNGTLCRLKDIQELFYDTGIGKEGYSLIGQGQIERIMNGKPQERRELFDEAAGIVKFKRRKSETQKKLEKEQENLVRLNDIIYELEKQVGPLKDQSEKAKTYLAGREEQKKLDLQLYAITLSDNEKQKESLEEKTSILSGQLSGLRSSYEKGREDVGKIEAAMENIDRQMEEGRKKQEEAALQKQGCLHRIELLEAQIRAQEENRSHYEKQKEGREKDKQRLEQEKAAILEKQKELEKERQELENAHQSLSGQLSEISEDASSRQKRLEEIRSALLKLVEEKTSAESRHQHFSQLMEQQQEKAKSLAEEKQENLKEETRILSQKQQWEQKYRDLKEKHEEYDRLIRQNAKDLEEATRQRDETAAACEETGRECLKLQSRLESLTNMAERYEGYGSSIRRVMERRTDYPGILGVVADLVRTAPKYETAVETALGGSLQNIVTSDEKTARDMIGYLKKNRYGRATFLPLTSVKGKKPGREETALSEEGVLGMADSLVSCEDKYRGIVSSLLGSILVVDTIEHALRIAKAHHYSLRIVTLEGEYLRPGGSLTGGAFRNTSNLLGRRRELAELKGKLAKQQEKHSELLAQQEKVRAKRQGLRVQAEQYKSSAARTEVEENTAKLNVQRGEDAARQKKEQRKSLEEQIGAVSKEIASMQQQGDTVFSASKEMEGQQKALEEESASLQEEISRIQGQRQDIIRKMQEASAGLASNQAGSRYQQEALERACRELEKTEKDLEGLEGSRKGLEGASGTKQQEILDQKAVLEKLEEDLEGAARKLEEQAKAKEQIQSSYREFFEKREEVSNEISNLEKEEIRLNTKSEQLQQKMEQQDAYLWEEYGLTKNHALEQKEETGLSPAELRRKAKEVKDKIRSLGDVNVGAIEEYKEVSQRYEFLSSQKKDMEQARENLEKMITSLDSGMRKRFREQFARIQSQFQTVFATLFGGGKGTLQLVEGEDVLDAGIEIIAEPPGKKLQNMMQLSGGEKSLTAIALLFAIQNLKPSPFCILDEIEAALDEPNVDRFADYLKKLSNNTQFIVITHRRGTMAAADRLYGITMQEKGVSTQVSVDLAQQEMEKEEEKTG